MGMVSLDTLAKRFGRPESRMAVIPRCDRARLMDLVKFSGVVEGERRSKISDQD